MPPRREGDAAMRVEAGQEEPSSAPGPHGCGTISSSDDMACVDIICHGMVVAITHGSDHDHVYHFNVMRHGNGTARQRQGTARHGTALGRFTAIRPVTACSRRQEEREEQEEQEPREAYPEEPTVAFGEAGSEAEFGLGAEGWSRTPTQPARPCGNDFGV